jgi:hypothetical protein
MRGPSIVGVVALGCAVTPPPREIPSTPAVTPRSPTSSRCEVDVSAPIHGGILPASFVTGLRADLAPPVARETCACTAAHPLVSPATVRVVVTVDPNRGRMEAVSAELHAGGGPELDEAAFEACLAQALAQVTLPPQPLGTCDDPQGAGGRIRLPLTVRTR